jgi:hypothetical protein
MKRKFKQRWLPIPPIYTRALTTFKLEGEVTSLSESSQGEVGDNREKLIAINRNILLRPL